MRMLGIVATVLLAGCGPALPDDSPPGPPPDWSPGTQAGADGVNAFAFDLYAKVREKTGNTFLSPFSVATAFAMLTDGANGPTRDELLAAFHFPPDLPATGDVGRYYAAGGKPYELSVANALWGQKGYLWRPEYLARQRERYGAGLTDHDFKRDPEGGRSIVNRWVERRTKDRIKNLMPQGSVSKDTRLVLANAIYFKGDWQDEFQKSATSDQPFTKTDGSQSPVPLMYRGGSYKHAQFDGFQVLEVPYKGGELAMNVILPDDPAGLSAVEARLTSDAGREWLGKLAYAPDVRVWLPRFKIESEYDLIGRSGAELTGPLPRLGVRKVFKYPDADLSGLVTHIPDADGLFVSAARHKAFVDVSETGTEAAAATGIGVTIGTSAPLNPPKPVIFRADHPFLFLIRDTQHGTVLFVGRYAGPGDNP